MSEGVIFMKKGPFAVVNSDLEVRSCEK